MPRDIEPACREIAGVSVHDIDDVQQIVERNTSGREAEARRAEHIIEAELDRFERWLASLEVVPTIAALRERGDEIVRRVLAENEARWESLGEADRERLEAMAKAIASRLLHEPTLRMRRAAGSDDAYLYVSALRELFGLDVETEPEAGARGASNVTELRAQSASPPRAARPSHDSHRHPRQQAGADAGRAWSLRCWAGRSWSRSPPTGSRGTSRGSCAGSSGRCWRGRPRSGSTRPRTCQGR